jgi:2-methylisocitrate lyase-like PEP mutase family enzyme
MLDSYCAEIGRNPAEIRRSAFVVPRRAGRDPWNSLDDFLAVLNAYVEAGASEIYVRMPDESRLDLLHEVARRLPHLRAEFAARTC